EGWGADEIRSTLTECYKWSREVIGPLNATADAEGCHLEKDGVRTPNGFKEAWKKLYEAGWKSIGVDAEYGGGGAPQRLRLVGGGADLGLKHGFPNVHGFALWRL